MKIWILKRLIPDEHAEVRIQFKAVYRTAEGAMRYVDEVFEVEDSHVCSRCLDVLNGEKHD